MPYGRGNPVRRTTRPPFGYFYGHYYASQAMFQYSRRHPEVWGPWIADTRRKFLTMWRRDGVDRGHWEDMIGKNYATAMACLVLQIHHEYLPIFQK